MDNYSRRTLAEQTRALESILYPDDPTEGLPMFVNGPYLPTTDEAIERLMVQEHGG